MAFRRYRVELCYEDDGLWSAVVPALPGCALNAESRKEAFDSMQECAQAFVDVLSQGGKTPPPEDVEAATEFVTVQVAEEGAP
ncbi:MAG TPA: type II toxin-antitoxin system HicB family antitoxin [Dehalococcoidia bacterium]|nr:type II toxin-antitoxin system HicB family antitoxin [Dehalococcoidia bacterium]